MLVDYFVHHLLNEKKINFNYKELEIEIFRYYKENKNQLSKIYNFLIEHFKIINYFEHLNKEESKKIDLIKSQML